MKKKIIIIMLIVIVVGIGIFIVINYKNKKEGKNDMDDKIIEKLQAEDNVRKFDF